MLDVVHCLLAESPEVLCALTENHISEFVKLLHANGRDHKVRCAQLIHVHRTYLCR